jgi:hypothetical protein
MEREVPTARRRADNEEAILEREVQLAQRAIITALIPFKYLPICEKAMVGAMKEMQNNDVLFPKKFAEQDE